MNYIVFDLEWNQSITDSDILLSPLCLPGEIIEIGAVKLDDTFRLIDERKFYVKPQYYTKLHRRIVQLTGIRDAVLAEEGQPFPEAFAAFREWCGEEYSYMTWSTSDLPILVDNMLLHGIDISDLPDTYDIQRIFCREIMRINRRLTLDDALKVLNEHGDPAHDALHDARNTATVIQHLNLAEYGDEYVSRAFAEAPLLAGYETRNAALAAPELRAFRCPWCGAEITAEPWLSMDHDEYISMGTCEEGDEILISMELIPASDLRPRRLFYEMSTDLWDIYSARKER